MIAGLMGSEEETLQLRLLSRLKVLVKILLLWRSINGSVIPVQKKRFGYF
jgi:hypothetical protein